MAIPIIPHWIFFKMFPLFKLQFVICYIYLIFVIFPWLTTFLRFITLIIIFFFYSIIIVWLSIPSSLYNCTTSARWSFILVIASTLAITILAKKGTLYFVQINLSELHNVIVLRWENMFDWWMKILT